MRANNTFDLKDFAEQAEATGLDVRTLAGDAATARRHQLEAETGLEHRRRWNPDAQTYTIERIPLKAPDQPWNMTDNRPPDRRTDWDKTPTQFTAFDRMILDAAPLRQFQWLSCPDTPRDGRPISAIREALQQGLDAQYGRGHFWAYNHGHRISIQCRYPLGEQPSEASIRSRGRIGANLVLPKGRVFAESTVILDEQQNVTKEEWGRRPAALKPSG